MTATGRIWSRPRRVCPDWCARRESACPAREGHPGGEHRADPITFTAPGAGSAVLTRVRSADGTDHAEIRLSVALPADDHAARLRLAALLTHLRTLIGPARATGRAA
jgi:hypothetical protein